MSLRVAAAVAAAVLLGARPAPAHVGAASDRTELLAHPDQPDRPGVDESFGLLEREPADGAWRWTCHELISSPKAGALPTLRRSGDGTLLATALMTMGARVPGEAVLRSEDGCDWTPPAGLTGRPVRDLAFAPDDPDVALAVTAAMPDQEVDGERIFRSEDGARSFAPVRMEDDGRVFTSVTLGPDGIAWALAVRAEPPGAFSYRSEDGGLTWMEQPLLVEGAPPVSMLLAAVDPEVPGRAWVFVDAPSEDMLVRTEDGGGTWGVERRGPSVLRDLAVGPDRRWLVEGDALYTAQPGGEWEPVDCAPRVRGVRPWGDGVLLATNLLAGDDAVVELRLEEDGSCDTRSLLRTLDIAGPRTCPADSDVARICAPLWDDLQEVLARLRPSPSPVTDDDDDDEPSGDCGACAGGAASLALLPLPLLRLRRRRGAR